MDELMELLMNCKTKPPAIPIQPKAENKAKNIFFGEKKEKNDLILELLNNQDLKNSIDIKQLI